MFILYLSIGNATNGAYLGGLIGRTNDCVIIQFGFSGELNKMVDTNIRTDFIGGIIGFDYLSTISNGYVTGLHNVDMTNEQYGYIGGMIGIADGSTVSKVYVDTVFHVAISSPDNYVAVNEVAFTQESFGIFTGSEIFFSDNTGFTYESETAIHVDAEFAYRILEFDNLDYYLKYIDFNEYHWDTSVLPPGTNRIVILALLELITE